MCNVDRLITSYEYISVEADWLRMQLFIICGRKRISVEVEDSQSVSQVKEKVTLPIFYFLHFD